MNETIAIKWQNSLTSLPTPEKARDLRIEKEKEEKRQKEIERREQGKQLTTQKDSFEQLQMKRAAEERRREKEQAKTGFGDTFVTLVEIENSVQNVHFSGPY